MNHEQRCPSFDNFNEVLLFGSWVIPSRIVGWGLLGLLCGFAAFSGLKITGSFEFIEPEFDSYIYLLLLAFAVIGALILGVLGYIRGLNTVVLYAMKKQHTASHIHHWILDHCSESETVDKEHFGSAITKSMTAFLTDQAMERAAAKDGPVTGYRAALLSEIKIFLGRRIVDCLTSSVNAKPGSVIHLGELKKESAERLDRSIEERINKAVISHTRLSVLLLFLIYSSVPICFVALTR
jgi:hypothetical protein